MNKIINTSKSSAFIQREIEAIQKIIADECWLEGERRGCAVAPDDPVIIERVCAIIRETGEKMRLEAEKAIGEAAGETD